eukprot:TRINITY_DN76373_c0_g1_i1.p1 TRINITY_DN76373_c0_g1~~TRINITY_DN76373_c0_g1_i1.p1  ORF type:complete len:256 (+),score=54.97 TRINITY_DN76373_c0_g1_i1:2-769(+)
MRRSDEAQVAAVGAVLPVVSSPTADICDDGSSPLPALVDLQVADVGHGASICGGGYSGAATGGGSIVAEVMADYDQRQARGKTWQDVHRSTLAGWAREGNIGCSGSVGGRAVAKIQSRSSAISQGLQRGRQTRSLPNLCRASSRAPVAAAAAAVLAATANAQSSSMGFSAVKSVQEMRARAVAKVAEAQAEAQAATVVVNMRNERVGGKEDLARIRCFSEARASGLDMEAESKENVEYDCRVCNGRHGPGIACRG